MRLKIFLNLLHTTFAYKRDAHNGSNNIRNVEQTSDSFGMSSARKPLKDKFFFSHLSLSFPIVLSPNHGLRSSLATLN